MTSGHLPFGHELVVDNFAGGGGASTGIEAGIGRPVDVAINHDPEAIAMHVANHPGTRHYCEDVFSVDPIEATRGRPVGLAWFSPDCKHHSKAKGGKPVDKKIRGLAWVVIRWAAKVRPRVIMLENVEEFAQWGPLTAENKPCPRRKGLTFRRWRRELERLGYHVEFRELRACDYGTPTIRKRLFIIARCDGLPIVWPKPTHGPGLLPYRTAAECIDWSIPCPSIFERTRPLAEATLRRIANGIRRYVIEAAEPFIVPLTHHGDSRAHSIREPMRTVTGAHRGEHALVTPYITEHANASSQRNMPLDEPMRTLCAEVKGGHFGLVAPYFVPRYGERPGQEPRCQPPGVPMSTVVPTGNGAQLVAAFLAKHFGGNETPGWPMSRPASTVTAKDHHALVTSHLLKLKGTSQHGQPVTEPVHTVQAGGQHYAEVRAFLCAYYGNDKDGQGMNDPLRTVTTKDRLGLVTIHGDEYRIVDIGMRMLQPRELYRAQGFPDSYIIAPEFRGKPLTKTAQVRMVGNSVCPPLAEVLVRANFAHKAEYQEATTA